MKDWQEIEESDKLQDQILSEIEGRVGIKDSETLFYYVEEVITLLRAGLSIKKAVDELMKDAQGLRFDEKFEILKEATEGLSGTDRDIEIDYHELKESEKIVHMNNDEILKLAHELVKEIL